MTRLEHIGIAVRDPAPVRRLLSELFGLEVYKVESVASERIDAHFIGADGVKLELLETQVSDSVIGRFLEQRGGGIHHLAFEVERLDKVLERATRLGLTPVNAEPKEGADGKRIFFLHPSDTYGILIEVCEADRFPGSRHKIPMPHGAVAAFQVGSNVAPTLLLLHDAGSSSLRDFGSLMARLEPYVHAVAFDAPGHGASSEWSPTSHFLRAADKHALAVLDYLEVDQAVVAGCGLGAAIAAAAAVGAPDRIRGLVLVDPNLLESDEEVASASHAVERACAESMPELAAHLVNTMEAAAETAVPLDKIQALSCPILVCGRQSSAHRRSIRLHEILPEASLAVLPEFDDRDESMARLLTAFVDSTDS